MSEDAIFADKLKAPETALNFKSMDYLFFRVVQKEIMLN